MATESSAAAAAPTAATTATDAATTATDAATTSETKTEPSPTTDSPPETTSTPETTSSTSSSDTSTTTSDPTTSSEPSTSSEPPTTTTSETSSTSATEPTTTPITTTIETQTPTDGTTAPQTLTITSTDIPLPTTTGNSADGVTATTSGSTATASSTDSGASGGSKLSTGGTIAVAVVVPVCSVAMIILAALYFYRKWKAKKAAEEERRKEVEEYGFNPNNDPSLPPIMGGGAFETKDDSTSGYRGWGNTSAGRKASTNLSSGPGVGLAMSEAGSVPGYHHTATPSDGTIQFSDGPAAGSENEPIGVLGAAPMASTNNRTSDIHRGPSNASSAYSAGNRSEASDESHMSATHPTGQYYEDHPYYNDMQSQYGAYGEGPYPGNQPVIRDVQARRNTRIENPAVFPRQGNAGIAQNF